MRLERPWRAALRLETRGGGERTRRIALRQQRRAEPTTRTALLAEQQVERTRQSALQPARTTERPQQETLRLEWRCERTRPNALQLYEYGKRSWSRALRIEQQAARQQPLTETAWTAGELRTAQQRASACGAEGAPGCGTADTSTVLATCTGALCKYCTVYCKFGEWGRAVCEFGEWGRAVCEFGGGRRVSGAFRSPAVDPLRDLTTAQATQTTRATRAVQTTRATQATQVRRGRVEEGPASATAVSHPAAQASRHAG